MKAQFDVLRIQALAEHFYNVTNMRISVYDDQYVQMVVWPQDACAFCTLMGNMTPFLEQNFCAQDDYAGFRESRKFDGPYHYVCYAGLDKIIMPIRLNGVVLGYVVMGQMGIGEPDEVRKRIDARCRDKGFTPAQLDKSFDSIGIFDYKHAMSAAELMRSCISHMCLSDQIRPIEGELVDELMKYINNHLAEDLSVETLCSEFGVSRYTLYRLSEEHFGVGIASYIRKTRIRAAIKLLSQKHSVMDTARRCGFEDYNYFSKVFKKETGVPPVEYWKKTQSEETVPQA